MLIRLWNLAGFASLIQQLLLNCNACFLGISSHRCTHRTSLFVWFWDRIMKSWENSLARGMGKLRQTADSSWPHPAPWPICLLLPCTTTLLSIKPSGQQGSDLRNKALGLLTTGTEFQSNQRWHQDLSCVPAPGPEKQQNQRKCHHGWRQDQLPWPMTPSPGADQSVETTILEGHPWKAEECSVEMLPWDLL